MNKRICNYSLAALLLTAFATPAFAEAGHDHVHKSTESKSNIAPSPKGDHSKDSAGHKKGHEDKNYGDDQKREHEAHEDEAHADDGNSNEAHDEGGHDHE